MSVKPRNRWLLGAVLVTSLAMCSCANRKADQPGTRSIDWDYYFEKAIKDESQVPDYELPDLLRAEDGEMIQDQEGWMEKRRPEILDLYYREIYGRIPEWNGTREFRITQEIPDALGGKARMMEVTALFRNDRDTLEMDILVYLPNDSVKSHPLFVGLNFFGNHTIYPDSNITVKDGYVINKNVIGVTNHRSTEAARGVMKERWQLEKVIENGYGLATVFYGDIDPDVDDGFQNGIHPLFYKKGQSRPKKDEWGSISAWAWGLSRTMDYFETDDRIDQSRVIVIGLSRLGKTALWAGARDERFAITISNTSGSGGAALFRRRFGETIEVSLAHMPQWYCGNFRKYENNEDALPVDQHMLVALVAPRPVYVASATEDMWADPRGEFLSAKHATPVYHLFGKQGIEVEEMPVPDTQIGGYIGYHIREGKHNITALDWDNYIAFANKHLKK